jgi:Lanthionine synthetase C-like protein
MYYFNIFFFLTHLYSFGRWCHGAPGMLILLCTVLRMGASTTFASTTPLTASLRDKIIVALHRGASLTYTTGLLRKGVGLCHGVAGSVYALLAVSDVLDREFHSDKGTNDTYLSKALHLAHLATSHAELTSKGRMRVPDRPWSLYEGMAGMCCAWADVLCRFEASEESGPVRRTGRGMPGFDDLPLPDI